MNTDPDARRRLAERLVTLVNHFAQDDSVHVHCLWPEDEVRRPAHAWFEPGPRRVVLDMEPALHGASMSGLNPLTSTGRRRAPVLIGLCAHEAAHARFSRWPQSREGWEEAGVDTSLLGVMALLEDPRVEFRQVREFSALRPYLRATLAVLGAEGLLTGRVSRWGAVRAAILLGGRVDGGVLAASDVAPLEEGLRGVLGDDYDPLRALWREALVVPDGDVAALADVAAHVVDLVGEPLPGEMAESGCGAGMTESGRADLGEGDDEGEEGFADDGSEGFADDGAGDDGADADDAAGDGQGQSEDPGGPEGSSDGSDPSSSEGEGGDAAADEAHGEGDGPGGTSSLDRALSEILEEIEKSATQEVKRQEQKPPPRGKSGQTKDQERQAHQQKQDMEVQQEAAKAATPFFAMPRRHLRGLRSRLPTPQERALAKRTAKALKRMVTVDRAVRQVRSEAPPGRMDGREAMLGDAQRSMGMMSTARPFRSKQYRRVPDPPLWVGFIGDGSGSMRWAESILATTAWTFSNAMRYLDGTSACVVFREGVIPLTVPGVAADRVVEMPSQPGSHNFAEAFQMVDGALNLTVGNGLRVLVVFSDGQFDGPQVKAAREAVSRVVRHGGHVLWICLEEDVDQVPPGAWAVALPEDVRGGGRMVNGVPEGAELIPDLVVEALRRGKKA